jgi:uncharacterized SAM-binding protein YcdF (DUF218 family)
MSPRKHSTFLGELGPGGLSSLSLALVTGALGVGIPVAWRLRQVLHRAGGDPLARRDAVLVLGRELENDDISEIFRARLEHGAALWRDGWAERVVVSGGWTGTASRSEAAAGRQHLLTLGVPGAAIAIEERSRFTLENLYNVRETARRLGWRGVLLVSDPLHLARARTMARGLALEVLCSPALQAPPRQGTASWWVRAAREAFLIHWYHVGVTYSRLIRSDRLLSRVT